MNILVAYPITKQKLHMFHSNYKSYIQRVQYEHAKSTNARKNNIKHAKLCWIKCKNMIITKHDQCFTQHKLEKACVVIVFGKYFASSRLLPETVMGIEPYM